jgi:hypothetical protein
VNTHDELPAGLERARKSRACRRGPRPWAPPDQQHMADVMRVVGQTSTPFVVAEYRCRLYVTGYRSELLVLVDVVRAMSCSRVRVQLSYTLYRREVRTEQAVRRYYSVAVHHRDEDRE